MELRWNAWNLEHAGRHGVAIPREAEMVVEAARRPYPEYRGDGKWLVIGRGIGGRWVQVIYVLDADGATYVLHARPLDDDERRRYRRRMR